MMRLSRTASAWRAPVLAGMLALAACHTSPEPYVVAASDPQTGMRVTLHMTDSTAHRGELLAVSDSSLVVLVNDRQVAVARFSSLRSVDFGYAAPEPVERGALPNDVLDHARSVSRFPYGITPAAMTALLRRTGQEAPLALGPRAP